MDCNARLLWPWILQARILEWVAIPILIPEASVKPRSPALLASFIV